MPLHATVLPLQMRAPGTLHSSNESTRASYQEVNAREQLLNSWHMSLVAMLPKCKHDKVTEAPPPPPPPKCESSSCEELNSPSSP